MNKTIRDLINVEILADTTANVTYSGLLNTFKARVPVSLPFSYSMIACTETTGH